MTNTSAVATASPRAKSQWPEIRTIGTGDILDALEAGIRDFKTAPKYGLFFGFVFAAGGWIIMLLLTQYDLPFLAYPLATGFALVAPFAASGLYDVSRKLELGQPLDWPGVLGAIRSTSIKELAWMAVVSVFSLIIWMDIAAFLFFAFMGFGGGDSGNLVQSILTTPAGWMFLAIGNVIGAFLAAIVFSYSAVSFPMLFDREVDFVTAMVTSVKSVLQNPRAMFFWAATIGILLLISLASLFIGLIVIMPVLGHTTWHVYRKVVGASPTPAA
ncbi:MAG: DUF2189 domain-containing protein [Hyphomicrobium sp.]|nr:DUF2189 domain-containing protein [Hyphomicrobium sp.]